MKTLGNILFSLLFSVFFALSTISFAEEKIVLRLQTELVSAWLVTVDGENRTRTLRILDVAEKDAETFQLDAVYGWTDGKQTTVRATISQTAQTRTLFITTQPGSKIVTTQKADGIFVGTFTNPSGVAKKITIEKFSESELAKTKSRLDITSTIEKPAANVPKDCAAFIGGWTGSWGFGQRWLWVVRIDAECTVKYSYSPRNPQTKNFKSAKIKGDVFSFPCGTHAGTCYFTNHGDTLWGRYSGPDGENKTTFEKVQ